MMGSFHQLMVVICACFVLPCLIEFATASEDWKPLNQEVCFEAKGKKPGIFKINDEGFLQGIQLTHMSGGVSCNNRHKIHISKFGCYSPWDNLKGKIGILITDKNGQVMFPLEMKRRHDTFVYSGGNTANSTIVTFYDDLTPIYVEADTELKLWYGEDFRSRTVNDGFVRDNAGKSCVKVKYLFAS